MRYILSNPFYCGFYMRKSVHKKLNIKWSTLTLQTDEQKNSVYQNRTNLYSIQVPAKRKELSCNELHFAIIFSAETKDKKKPDKYLYSI